MAVADLPFVSTASRREALRALADAIETSGEHLPESAPWCSCGACTRSVGIGRLALLPSVELGELLLNQAAPTRRARRWCAARRSRWSLHAQRRARRAWWRGWPSPRPTTGLPALHLQNFCQKRHGRPSRPTHTARADTPTATLAWQASRAPHARRPAPPPPAPAAATRTASLSRWNTVGQTGYSQSETLGSRVPRPSTFDEFSNPVSSIRGSLTSILGRDR